MAVQTRTIKRRIKSVTNTRKITKAMELVAGSKMRKAVNAVLGTRPYARLAWGMVQSVAKGAADASHPLLETHEGAGKALMIVITSDRGLAGGYNANLVKAALARSKDLGMPVETVCIGRRGADVMRRAGVPVIASFTELTNNTTFEETLPIGRMVIEEYAKGSYDKVLVAYTDFKSAISQQPLILDLLPLGAPEATESLGSVREQEGTGVEAESDVLDYTFEPSPARVLEALLPRLVETMVYQAILEAAASEHSARMMAMRSASDAASDMIEDLTFTFNQARQAGITQEIAEISSGKAALEG